MGALLTYLEMGGYAAFVWPSFPLSAAVLGLLAWSSVRALKRAERALAALDSRRPPQQP